MSYSRPNSSVSDMSRGLRRARLVSSAGALLLFVCAGLPPTIRASAAGQSDIDAEVLALVLEVDSDRAAPAVSRRMKRLGIDALPSLFTILSIGSIAGAEPFEMTPDRERVLREGILAQGLVNVRSFLSVTASAESPSAVRKTALSIYQAMGNGSDLKRIIALGAGDDSEVLGDETRACTAAVLRRDPRGHLVLGPDLAREFPLLFPYLLDAVGDTGSPAGLRFLGRVLARRCGHDAAALRHIELIGEGAMPPFAPELRSAVRAAFDYEDDQVAEAAARASGALADTDAVEALSAMLETRPARVRGAAHEALKRISGQSFGSTRARWESWHADELDWWEEESGAVLERLASDELQHVAAALGQIVRRRLFRDELAGAVLPLLGDSRPEVRRLACQGLSQLGCTRTMRALVEMLTDMDGSVAREALNALQSLSGEDLPPDPETWRTFLDDRGGRLAR
jgi:hypothetical protein